LRARIDIRAATFKCKPAISKQKFGAATFEVKPFNGEAAEKDGAKRQSGRKAHSEP
jgi:hypothetical protein